MLSCIQKITTGGALSLLAFASQATPLPAYNLDFTQFQNNSSLSDGQKVFFGNDLPVGWTYSPPIGGTNGSLVFVGAPNSATNGPNGVYGPFPNTPTGGNFVQADGNPYFESVFYETITGLTPGETYSLSFYQAAGQQQGFSGPTQEQWIVSLGTSQLEDALNASQTNGVYSNPDPNADIVSTAIMNTPSEGVTPWNYVTVDLTADASTQLLSFLAWGDGGSTANLPPMVFLSGVNQPDVLPEPSSIGLVAVALAGLTVVYMRGKRKA